MLTPTWPHYSAVLEAVYEQQARKFLGALPHDQYLFQCGVLFAIEQVMRAPEAIIDAVKLHKDMADARERASAEQERRTANAFLNTPWWDQYIRDRVAQTPT